MPLYTVKSSVKTGRLDSRGKLKSQTLRPGKQIELTEEQAYEIRHALKDGPKEDPSVKPMDPKVAASLLGNPLNPESGVELFWKTQPNAFKRTEANKTQREKELAPGRQRSEAKTKAAGTVRPVPQSPAVAKAPQPVVPPITRPAPAAVAAKSAPSVQVPPAKGAPKQTEVKKK